jgi:hypothetical protein
MIGIALIVAASPVAVAAIDTVLPGRYTNEEQVEFARDQGTSPLPWVGVEISREADGLHLRTVDAFGARGAEHQRILLEGEGEGVRLTMGRCRRLFVFSQGGGLTNSETSGRCDSPAALTGVDARGLTMRLPDGRGLALLRARPWRCWAAVPKRAAKADGSADWWFKAGMPIHDRGGRLVVETDEPEPQRYVLRMRNVIFPEPPNQPSLVLYVHAEDPVRALSYGWADPEARRLGINLRRIQASCSLVGEAMPETMGEAGAK